MVEILSIYAQGGGPIKKKFLNKALIKTGKYMRANYQKMSSFKNDSKK